MRCKGCKREINLDNIVISPLLFKSDPPVIDNVLIYSQDCVDGDCFCHIHIDRYDIEEGEISMPLKELIAKYGLAEKEI